MAKRKFPKLHKFNDMQTPSEALNYICPFLDKSLSYWEACFGMGYMAETLRHRGFSVVGWGGFDCLKYEYPTQNWDFWITNPPFSNNKVFLQRAIELGKPFAFLLRLEHLGGIKAMKLLTNLNFCVIIPEHRINYITPKMLQGKKVGGAQYHSIWLTFGVDLPKQINYVKTLKD